MIWNFMIEAIDNRTGDKWLSGGPFATPAKAIASVPETRTITRLQMDISGQPWESNFIDLDPATGNRLS